MVDALGYLSIPPFALSHLGLFLAPFFLAVAFYLLTRKGQTLTVPAFKPFASEREAHFPWQRLLLSLFAITLSFLLLDPLSIDSSDQLPVPLPTEGRSFTLLIDRSGSMWRNISTPDGEIEPLVKYAANLFEEQMKGREGDLVSLVAFARTPDLLLPLTPDKKRLNQLLSGLQKVPPEADGTAITYSLYKTLLMVEGAKEKESLFHLNRNVIILVTDGFEKIPDEDARDPLRGVPIETVLKKAQNLGVHIYIVSFFPKSENLKYGPELRRMEQIGRVTEGGFYQATPEALKELFEKIDRQEGGSATAPIPPKKIGVPLAPTLALVALGILFVYLLMREVVYLTLP